MINTFVAVPADDTWPPTGQVPCQQEDPELWFSESPSHLELAKAHCQRCPFRSACLARAVERAEPWGVWGGEIIENGLVIARKRGRGRPRRDVEAA